MIDRLEELHKNRIIHQDIKPQNTTIGINDQTNRVHLIDFGISEIYLDHRGRHTLMKKTENFHGTLRYAASNAHNMM